MFHPLVVLIFIAVACVHGALLLLLSGEAQLPDKTVQHQVIQGILLAAPVSVAPEKVTSLPEKKPLQKTTIKKQAVKKVIKKRVETPPKEIVEAVKEAVVERSEPKTEVEEKPTVEESAETSLPPPSAVSDVEPAPITPPRIGNAGHLKNPPPSYPRLSKRLREEGEVILELWVLADGSVSEVTIKTSSGYPRLDNAALKAVKKWRYTPATRHGEAIAYRYQQPIQFSMK